MRFVISIVAVLMILGLAAFGVVWAQKMSTGAAQATASDSPPAAAQTAPIAARRHPVNPVSQLAQTDAESAAVAGAPHMQVAQATHSTAPAAANGSPISTMRASPIPPGLSQAGMALAAGAGLG